MEKQTWCKQKTALLKTDGSRICVRVQQIIRPVSRLNLSWVQRNRSLDKKARALASPPPPECGAACLSRKKEASSAGVRGLKK